MGRNLDVDFSSGGAVALQEGLEESLLEESMWLRNTPLSLPWVGLECLPSQPMLLSWHPSMAHSVHGPWELMRGPFNCEMIGGWARTAPTCPHDSTPSAERQRPIPTQTQDQPPLWGCWGISLVSGSWGFGPLLPAAPREAVRLQTSEVCLCLPFCQGWSCLRTPG